MAVTTLKRRSERLNRRKFTMDNKAHELVKFYDVDVRVVVISLTVLSILSLGHSLKSKS
jgi:hypothetical protein